MSTALIMQQCPGTHLLDDPSEREGGIGSGEDVLVHAEN